MTVNNPLPAGSSSQQESPLPFTSVLPTPEPPEGEARSTHFAVGHSPMGAPALTALGNASKVAPLITPTSVLFRIQDTTPPPQLVTRASHVVTPVTRRRH